MAKNKDRVWNDTFMRIKIRIYLKNLSILRIRTSTLSYLNIIRISEQSQLFII